MGKTEQGGKLLVVDDDTVCVFSIRRLLKKMDADCELLVARDGKEALDVLHREIQSCETAVPPMVVMLDQHMPRMNGDEFLQAVEDIPELSGLTVFAFTSGGKRDRHSPEFADRVAGYISKDRLQEALDMALGAAHLPAERPESQLRRSL